MFDIVKFDFVPQEFVFSDFAQESMSKLDFAKLYNFSDKLSFISLVAIQI
jgi:hypothetical protein